ncbi:MAG: DUF1549 domain-containing protein [Verrucomicrobia subdivision 3 bacterium]|nr:DUF1549 domain-containing protein [Limisphaerales bacterium]
MRVWIAILFSGLLFSADADDFKKDIQPLLKNKCSRCHSGHQAKGGFSINTRKTLLEGAKAGDSAASEIFKRITSADPDERMPSKGKPLAAKEIALIKAWIDDGIAWPEGYNFAEWHRAPLGPREVKLAPGKGNPVDQLLAPYLAANKVDGSKLIDDRVFARRVWLDLVGLLPPVDELKKFVRDKAPDKRAKLVGRLLADNRKYADHWMTFWNDHLRNAYFGPGFIDGGRKQITGWLFESLFTNKPYDQFVHELVAGAPGAEGFLSGIKWRGAVNASQRREMQAAQNLAQVFMGTNLKCASCHNSFVNYWTLEDSYSLAAIFANGNLELHRCDLPTGKTATPRFIFPELGSINAKAPRAARLNQLAGLVTSPKNGRLRRVIVNRLWSRLMGRGLVEPLDDLDQPAWHPDLLDWLANDLAANKHDLKHTLRLICTSRAYQLPSVAPTNEKQFVFRGPSIKRLQAEQFIDALSTLGGDWQPNGFQRPDGRKQGGQVGAVGKVLAAQQPPAKPLKVPLPAWIWDQKNAAQSAPLETIYLRKTFTLTKPPKSAPAVATCDNEYVLFVNGQRADASKNWSAPARFNLAQHLRPGANTIAVQATNIAPGPAGFIFRVQLGDTFLLTDNTWLVTKQKHNGWEKPGFKTQGWKHAAVLGNAGLGPWKLAGSFGGNAPVGTVEDIRAVLARLDPLQLALGRPNRDQVVTARDTLPTLLQALEMTNGNTLDACLKRAAAQWLRDEPHPIAMANVMYETALGRLPTRAELAIARDILGEKPSLETAADLLWIVVMLPEFQLIY